jgi:tRNA pseudouridine55 synthase
MNGLLIIDKPSGITSHDVVAGVRRILRTKRVGHTGTLDPFATGVMVVLIGQATRLAQFLDKDVKEYEALVRFGSETDTGDRTGTARSTAARPVSIDNIESVLDRFRGEIEQIPPMYSAKKIDGKKLYESARKGLEIERKPSRVTIHLLDIIDVSDSPDIPRETFDLKLRVSCSAGTYMRTLAEDIARSAGTAAHLAELRRTKAGKFGIGTSISLEELGQMAEPAAAIVPMERAVEHLSKFTLSADRVSKTQNGLSTRVFDANFAENEAVQMLDETGRIVAIGFFDSVENVIQPKVVLV